MKITRNLLITIVILSLTLVVMCTPSKGNTQDLSYAISNLEKINPDVLNKYFRKCLNTQSVPNYSNTDLFNKNTYINKESKNINMCLDNTARYISSNIDLSFTIISTTLKDKFALNSILTIHDIWQMYMTEQLTLWKNHKVQDVDFFTTIINNQINHAKNLLIILNKLK